MSATSEPSNDNFLKAMGIVIFITLIFKILKEINRSIETKLISDDGLSALQNPQKKQNLDNAIRFYKKYDKWDPELLTSEKEVDIQEKEKELEKGFNS